jgi:hypothetical protein
LLLWSACRMWSICCETGSIRLKDGVYIGVNAAMPDDEWIQCREICWTLPFNPTYRVRAAKDVSLYY